MQESLVDPGVVLYPVRVLCYPRVCKSTSMQTDQKVKLDWPGEPAGLTGGGFPIR
jgi:hypothetical protein